MVDDIITIGVQVNGKLRSSININLEENEEDIKKTALTSPNVLKYTKSAKVIKVIYVPKKIVSVVIK